MKPQGLVRTLYQENEKLLERLESIQSQIRKEKQKTKTLEKENQKLRILQPFGLLLQGEPTEIPENLEGAQQVLNELKKIREAIAQETQYKRELLEEQQELIETKTFYENQIKQINRKPTPPESPRKSVLQRQESSRKLKKGKSYKEIHSRC